MARYMIFLVFFEIISCTQATQAIRLIEFHQCKAFFEEINISQLNSLNQVAHDKRLDMCFKIIDWIKMNESSFYQPEFDELIFTV